MSIKQPTRPFYPISYMERLFRSYIELGQDKTERFLLRYAQMDGGDIYVIALTKVLQSKHPEYLDLFEKMRLLI